MNAFNGYIESVNIPGRSINVNESRTANSIPAKIAGEVAVEDLEVTWRATEDFSVYSAIRNWMNAVKRVTPTGSVVTGYCQNQACKIGILPASAFTTSENQTSNPTMTTIVTIDGLYPINLQAIQFQAEGGEYVKIVATFSCYKILDGDANTSVPNTV
jgi:hypothetical protein